MDSSWVKKHFDNASLGDARLNKRLVKIAEQCMENPGASMPKRCNAWKDVKGAYRFLANEKVTHAGIQKQHNSLVRQEAEVSTHPVLFIQDGSEILYNTHRCTQGLGPTADSQGNGMMMHNCLAAVFHEENCAEILGLAKQKLWVRSKDKKQSTKESHAWQETLEAIGPPPRDKHWISVCDRGADIFAFLSWMDSSQWGYVVRAKHDRPIEGKEEKLFSWIRKQDVKGEDSIYLRARHAERPKRSKVQFSGEVALNITWATVSLQAPANAGQSDAVVSNVVRVFSESLGIEWVLLSNLPIEGVEDALKIIQIYRARWLIEEFHKALKTGCRVEDSQLQQGRRLEALVAILSVVASRLLSLKEKCRIDAQRPAQDLVPRELILLICHHFSLEVKGLTIRDFWRHVARLGGFIGRKSDGEPGWLTIWRGYECLKNMWLGVQIAQGWLAEG